MPLPEPSKSETADAEIRAVLLAAQEMAPGEVGDLIRPALDAARTTQHDEPGAQWTTFQFFCALFAALIWFLLLPWWAAYLLLNLDAAAHQGGAVILAVWAASIFATIATLIRRFGMRRHL